jgi:hypothetical protein
MRIKQISLFCFAITISTWVIVGNAGFCKKEINGKIIYVPDTYGCETKPTPPPPVVIPQPKPTKPELYYAGWDPNSQQAIKFFRDNHIVVDAYDIEQDHEAAARKKAKAPNFSGIPLVVINGITILGFDERKYQDALSAGIKPPQ